MHTIQVFIIHDKWFALCDIIHKFRSRSPEMLFEGFEEHKMLFRFVAERILCIYKSNLYLYLVRENNSPGRIQAASFS